MIKKLKLGAMTAGLLFNFCAFAAPEYILQMGVPLEIILPSNEPKVIPNVFMWTIKGHCVVVSDEQENFVTFKALRKAGSVNGTRLTEGESLSLIVHPDEVIQVSAEANAKVEILNTGPKLIKAICTGD